MSFDQTNREMVIFTRTFEFLSWLMPLTNHFPKSQRFLVTTRLLNAAFDLREHLDAANLRRDSQRLECLLQADEALAKVRLYFRLARRWGWIGDASYLHGSDMLGEIGKLLGGWIKQCHP